MYDTNSEAQNSKRHGGTGGSYKSCSFKSPPTETTSPRGDKVLALLIIYDLSEFEIGSAG